MSAIYRFEQKASTENASQPGGRLAYVGLGGSFGTVSLGQIWSASFNHVGGITDGSWAYGNSHTSYRVPSAVSYSISAGMASLQIDAIMDGSKDTGDAVDQLEFGMTFDLGDIGKVGLAYVDTKSHMMPVADKFMAGTPTKVTVTPGSAGTAATPPTVTVTTKGEASVPTMVSEVPKEVPAEFTLSVGEDGELMVTKVKGLDAPTGGYSKEQMSNFMYEDDAVKYSAILDVDTSNGSTTGAFQTTAGAATVEREAVRVSFLAPVAVTAKIGVTYQDLLMLVDDATTGTGFKKIGNVYVHSDCLNSAYDGINSDADNCGNPPKTVYKVSYTQPSGQTTIDGEAGRVNRASFTDTNTLITGSVEGMRVDGVMLKVEDGKPSVPTEVEVTPGTDGDPATPPTVAVAPGTPGDFVEQDDKEIPGSRDTHIAAQFNLGAVTAYLGHSQSETNGSGTKSKVTHYGVSGGIGDTGMSFNVMARNKNYETAKEGESPWLVGLTKSLGGGATAFMEHGNSDNGESGKTRLGFKVDF